MAVPSRRSLLPSTTLACAIGAALLCGCSGAKPQGSEGETHWLSACEVDADCGADGSCICGTCTVGCAGDATCQGSPVARCFATSSPGLTGVCGESVVVPPSAICLADCTGDEDCDSAQRCLQGACVAKPIEAPAQDPLREDGPESPDPRDYRAVVVDVSAELEAPPTVPLPSATLVAAQPGFELSSLEGIWRQQCAQEVSFDGPIGCLKLTFEGTPDGASLRGTLELEPIGDGSGFSAVRPGPFGPPEAGVPYPPGETETEHTMLIQYLTTGVPYRTLDLEAGNDFVSFWTSPFELWVDWCPLQTSSLGQMRGQPVYRCIPGDATVESVGPEMFRLCSSEFVSFASVCQCSAEGCVANDHVAPWHYRFRREGDQLVGRWLEEGGGDIVLGRLR